MNEAKKDTKNKKIIIARAMIFIMLILVSGLILYMYTVDRIKYSEEKAISGYTEVQFDRVWSELQFLRSQAHDNAKNVAETIEFELRQQNLDELKEDMDNGVMNETMYNIIKYAISGKSMNGIGNYRNGIVVMTQNGIFEDFNYERVDGLDDDTAIRTWQVEIDTAYNKKLEEEAIHRLLNHTNSIIATEKVNRLGDDHIMIDTMDYDSLKEVFTKEGMDGLKNYQFINPAYITETGDIFGQDDIVQGVKQPNHKIIIVQEFNLYDQLEKINSAMFDMDDHINTITEDYSITTSIMYIMGLFYVASTITLLFYFSHLYNYYIGIHDLENEETETDKIIEKSVELDRMRKERKENKKSQSDDHHKLN